MQTNATHRRPVRNRILRLALVLVALGVLAQQAIANAGIDAWVDAGCPNDFMDVPPELSGETDAAIMGTEDRVYVNSSEGVLVMPRSACIGCATMAAGTRFWFRWADFDGSGAWPVEGHDVCGAKQ